MGVLSRSLQSASAGSKLAQAVSRQSTRGMGGHAGGRGYGEGPFRGFKPPKGSVFQKNLATGFGTVAWLWFFWRCKIDGPREFVRLRDLLAHRTRAFPALTRLVSTVGLGAPLGKSPPPVMCRMLRFHSA